MALTILGKGDVGRLLNFKKGDFEAYELYIGLFDDGIIQKINELPKHIKFISIHNPTQVKIQEELEPFNLLNEGIVGEESLKVLQKTINLAQEIGVRKIVVHGARYDMDRLPREKAFELLRKRIEFLDTGEVDLCFETDVGWHNTFYPKMALLTAPGDFHELKKVLNEVRITADIEHLCITYCFNQFIEQTRRIDFLKNYLGRPTLFEKEIYQFIKENFEEIMAGFYHFLEGFFSEFKRDIKHIHLNGSDPLNFFFNPETKLPLKGEHLPLGFEEEGVKDRFDYEKLKNIFSILPEEVNVGVVIEAWRTDPKEFILEMRKSKELLEDYLTNLVTIRSVVDLTTSDLGENKMIKIGNKEIKNFGEPFIIAEVGSNHNGDLGLAKQLVDKAVGAGADVVKFQAFDTSIFSEACYEKDPRREDLMGSSPALRKYFTEVHAELKREVKEYMAPKEMLREIKKYCDEKGIMFACTPLDEGAVDFLVDELEAEFIKIASMDLNHPSFLKYIAAKQKPMVLPTGMGSFSEIMDACEAITSMGNNQLVILHCVSTYPPKDENVNLNNLEMLRANLDFPIGWSDHTLGCTVPLAAVAKGACVVEKHFTLDKNLPGWDHKVSATPEELKLIVEESKRIWKSLGSYKRVLPQDEIDKRALFRRSIVVNKDLPAGYVITNEDLEFKRPGTGVEPKEAKFVVGRTLKRDLNIDDLVSFGDLV
jgi:sialic acid synthase SpsE/sugar phosphate isomerase/epimerase